MVCSGLVEWTLPQPSSLVLFGLIGCSATPDPWDCFDPECRSEALLSEWRERPGDAVESISQLPDDVEKIKAIAMLIDHHPGETGALCELLPHGMSKERCVYVNSHPTAWLESGSVGVKKGRAGTGPARSRWSAADFESSDMIAVRSVLGVCQDEIDPHACAWSWAQSHASEGDAELSASMCAAVRSPASATNRWRHFCFLSAAEEHIEHWERARYVDSIRLCGASGALRAICNDGLIEALAVRVPASDVGDERAWMDHLLRARAVAAAWEGDPMRSEIMDRFWAVSMRASVAKSKGLSGDALDYVPRSSVPHVHASLAWEAVSRWDGPLEYEIVQRRVVDALSLRLNRVEGTDEIADHEAVADLWPVDRDGEAHLSAVSYFGDSRRTVARDIETDVGLCVLEAAARLSSPALELLEQARSHPDERLKWTAARLLEQLKVTNRSHLPSGQ